MAQSLSQEVSQELDCKDNQDDNDSRQNGHIVIVAVKSISDGYVTHTTSSNCPAMAVLPTSEIKVTVVTRIKSGRPSSKLELPRLKFFTRKTSFF